MHKITTPVKHIIGEGIKVAKSLTFWSVILGFLLAWDYNLGSNVFRIWSEQGWTAASRSNEYILFWPITILFLGVFGLFFITERKQSTKTEVITKEISVALNAIHKAIDKNTEELKRFSLTTSQSHKEEGGNRPDNQSNDDTK